VTVARGIATLVGTRALRLAERSGGVRTVTVAHGIATIVGTRVLRLVELIGGARLASLSSRRRRAVAHPLAEAVCPPKGGLLFGDHDYRDHVASAAKAPLPKALADVFAGTHTRSARTTHLLEASGNLAGVQFLVGHKQGTTTASHMRPSQRAAEAAPGSAFGGRRSNTVDDEPTKRETPESEESRVSA